MQPIADLGPEQLSTGVSPATNNSATSLWKFASNVIFREAALRPEPGQIVVFQKQSGEPVCGFGETERGGRPILFWGTPSKLYRGDRLTVPPTADVSDATYGGIADATNENPATRWSISPWGEWAVAANGIDEFRAFKPTNSVFRPLGHASVFGTAYKPPAECAALGIAFRPTMVLRSRGHLLAFKHHRHATPTSDSEITEGEQSVWWCDNNNLADWEPREDNAAGSLIMRQINGEIRAAHPLLDGAGVYSENNLVLLQYLGDPLYFGAVRALDGVGAFGQHSVVPVSRMHYGAGPRGLWRTDGTEFQYFDHPMVRDWFLTRLTRSQRSKVIAWHDTQYGRVVWFFPADGSLVHNSSIGFDYEQGIFHIPGYIRCAAAQQEVFPYPITASLDGNIYEQSAVGGVSASPGSPLELNAQYTLSAGYGVGGYGLLSYGGEASGDG